MKEILLVEASPALLACRVKTLKRQDYQVTGASTAGDIAKAMKQGSYDLIVVDAGVPEALEVLSPAGVPTLIMADEETVGSIASVLPVGVWAFLVKPFTAGEFSRAVAEAIDKADAIKDAMQQRTLLPLRDTGKLLVSEAETEKFFKHILEITAAETEADRVSLLVLDEKTGQLAIKAQLGLKLDVNADEKIGQWVMKTSQPLMINSRVEANSSVKEIMSQLGASSLLSVPLSTKEEVIGVINNFKVVKGAQFTSANLEFLSIFARQVAIATENANLFKSLQKQQLQLERLIEKAVLTQENERKRVAIEIHDSIGQQLVGALYRIRAFEFLLSVPLPEEAQAEASKIKDILEKTLNESRRILAGLQPLNLDELGFTSALRQEAERLNKETNTKCDFQVEGEPIETTSSQKIAIYRVIQEALNNIRKHANATEAKVQLCFEPGTVSVKVSDDGKGFKLDGSNTVGHLGLFGMKERAEMLGGNLNITSQPGSGTSILLTFPTKS